MGVGVVIYCTRTGGFAAKKKVESGCSRKRQESGTDKVWIIEIVTVILLVIGGVEVNPGPQAEQAKIDQILTYVKNQEKESKVIKQMVEAHKKEMVAMRKEMDSLGHKFNQLCVMVEDMVTDYAEMKQALREREASCRQLENELRKGDEDKRKNNIIFGFKEQSDENYFETLKTAVKWLNGSMKVEVNNENIDYVKRVGRRKGEWPILVRFMSFSKKRGSFEK
jgi:hypothetical protein